jgi:CheY-like chemotaxis protein
VRGAIPLLDVGALLGRRRNDGVAQVTDGTAATRAPSASVLIVNSSEVERTTLAGLLGDASYRTLSVQSAGEALEAAQDCDVDLVLCDLRLPEMNAQQFAELKSRSDRFAKVPVLLVLSHVGEQSHLVVQQLGAAGFVRAPIQREELMNVVQRLLEGSG